MRRRMAERRHRRAKADETEREGEEKQADEPHYLGAKLLESSKAAGTRRNGGAALAQARICGGCELGFANARGGGCGSGGFKGVAGLAFIGAGRGLGVRAQGNTAARKSRSDLTESPARTGKEEDPDERGPPSGETGRGGGRWAELGQETGERAGVENGLREGFLGHGVKERDGLGERRKGFAFF